MYIILRGHEYKYAMEQMLLTLFPEERPVYADAPEGRCEPRPFPGIIFLSTPLF